MMFYFKKICCFIFGFLAVPLAGGRLFYWLFPEYYEEEFFIGLWGCAYMLLYFVFPLLYTKKIAKKFPQKYAFWALLYAIAALMLGGLVLALTAQAEEAENKVLDEIKSETKKYTQECFEKTYPKNFEGVNIYNDEIKHLDYQYHQCLKEIIISKINQFCSKEDAEKMQQDLDKIQDGVLSFYWNLYNREDFGSIGRGMNDASLGRYYEHILEDIIHFETMQREQ